MSQEIDELKKTIEVLDQRIASMSITLSKIQRKMRWASVYGFIKFFIIVAPLVWAYVFFQPQIQEFYSLYGKMMEQFRSLQTIQQMQKPSSGTDNAELLRQLQERYPQFKQ